MQKLAWVLAIFAAGAGGWLAGRTGEPVKLSPAERAKAEAVSKAQGDAEHAAYIAERRVWEEVRRAGHTPGTPEADKYAKFVREVNTVADSVAAKKP